MNFKNILIHMLVLCYMLIFSDALTAQQLVEKLNISEKEATLSVSLITPDAYAFQIAGPKGYFYEKEVPFTKELSFSNLDEKGQVYEDGLYKLQISPIFKMTEANQAKFRAKLAEGDENAIANFREANNIPSQVEVYNVAFSIKDGKFITPDTEKTSFLQANSYQWTYESKSYQAMFASIKENNVNLSPSANALVKDNTSLADDDQVFLDDVIIQGSICVGLDCSSTGESFEFDTQRFKENNLRIHFDDTSNSASFPQRDWRISINDSGNGGSEYFGIEDATAGRIPFRIEGNAPANSLYVDNSGRLGIGTATPTLEIHVADGDSPSLRLEQNGSSGFGVQTWDIAGNESNFFIRDLTNGSLLPLRIRPSAPSNSLYIDADGDIGLGTANPGNNALQIESGDVLVKNGALTVNGNSTLTGNMDVTGNMDLMGNMTHTGDMTFTGTIFNTGDLTHAIPSVASFYNSTYTKSILCMDGATGNVGMGIFTTPSYQLEISGDAAKPGGGDWATASDRRLKKDIKPFEDGLGVVMEMKPVTFKFNGKLGYKTEKEFVGVIAQDMVDIAPYTIEPLKRDGTDTDYLSYDGSAVTYLLVNAVQEQQTIIEAQQKEIDNLQKQIAQIDEMKEQMAALTKMLTALNAENEVKEAGETSDDDE